MNPRLLSLALLAAAMQWASAAAEPLQVTESVQARAPLGAAYAWVAKAQTPRTSNPKVDNITVDQRVRLAFDSALSAKGFQLASDPANAQLLISYDLQLYEEKSENMFDTNMFCGPQACVGGRGPIHTRRGELTLQLLDKASGQIAWSASSTKTIKKSEASQANLDKIAREMTTNLPAPSARAASAP